MSVELKHFDFPDHGNVGVIQGLTLGGHVMSFADNVSGEMILVDYIPVQQNEHVVLNGKAGQVIVNGGHDKMYGKYGVVMATVMGNEKPVVPTNEGAQTAFAKEANKTKPKMSKEFLVSLPNGEVITGFTGQNCGGQVVKICPMKTMFGKGANGDVVLLREGHEILKKVLTSDGMELHLRLRDDKCKPYSNFAEPKANYLKVILVAQVNNGDELVLLSDLQQTSRMPSLLDPGLFCGLDASQIDELPWGENAKLKNEMIKPLIEFAEDLSKFIGATPAQRAQYLERFEEGEVREAAKVLYSLYHYEKADEFQHLLSCFSCAWRAAEGCGDCSYYFTDQAKDLIKIWENGWTELTAKSKRGPGRPKGSKNKKRKEKFIGVSEDEDDGDDPAWFPVGKSAKSAKKTRASSCAASPAGSWTASDDEEPARGESPSDPVQLD